MEIAQISTIDGYLTGGNSMRVSGICSGLHEMGHSVVAVCASGSQRLVGGYRKVDSPLLRWYGPRSPLGRPSVESSFIGGATHRVLVSLSEICLGILDSCSVLHCHQHWAASIVERRRRRGNQKLLFDYHDPILSTDVNGAIMLSVDSRLESRVSKWEQRVFDGADAISFVSPLLRDRVAQLNGIEVERTCVIPDGVDFDYIHGSWSGDAVCRLKSSWGAEMGTTVMYVGSLGPLHGGGYLMKVIRDLLEDTDTNASLKFVVVGHGTLANEFDRLQKKFAGRMIYVPGISYSSLPTYLAAADILLVPHPKNLLMDSIESGKLITYLASGKPTVVTRLTSTAGFLDDGVNSVLCDPDASSTMVDQIKRLASSEDLRRQIGARGALLVKEKRDWKSIARMSTEIYRNLLLL